MIEQIEKKREKLLETDNGRAFLQECSSYLEDVEVQFAQLQLTQGDHEIARDEI
jgi:hypothetical protein